MLSPKDIRTVLKDWLRAAIRKPLKWAGFGATHATGSQDIVFRRFVDNRLDRPAYFAANPDVAAAGADPVEHWLNHGFAEGRELPGYIILRGADASQAPNDPHSRFHWRGETFSILESPARLRRFVEANLDRPAYLAANPDVAAACADPVEHWLNHGFAERREFPGFEILRSVHASTAPDHPYSRFHWQGQTFFIRASATALRSEPGGSPYPGPSIDVVIPVRNRALYIAACLDSVRAQTFQPTHVIVVDDGSTDDTVAILDSYARDWPKLHVICTGRRGASSARNTGIAATTSPLIAFLDSDDIWHPEKLARQVALFSPQRPRLGIVHCGLVEIDERGKSLSDAPVLPWRRGYLFDAILNEFYHLVGSLSAVVIRRTMLLAAGGFDKDVRIGEDIDLFLRLARACEIDYVPEALTYLRRHPQSTHDTALRSNREFILCQRLAVWNKWTADITDMNCVLESFSAEARAAHLSNIFRFMPDFGLFERLKQCQSSLAKQLYAANAGYGAKFAGLYRLQLRLKKIKKRLAQRTALDPASDPFAAPDTLPERLSSRPLHRAQDSDVSALILTLGESTTEEAVESVRRQSHQVAEIVFVHNVTPFHAAFNSGVEKLSSEFFVQVDADMILDRHCVEILRSAVRSDVGIVVGYLRDGLMKQVVGIKLFRKACFSNVKFRNSISPNTDFVDEIASAGWKTIYVERPQGGDGPATVGVHRPDYSPEYTYVKYLMEGTRYHHRGDHNGFLGHLAELEKSTHPVSLIAQIAFAHGIFRTTTGDQLGLRDGADEFGRLKCFLSAASTLSPTDFDMNDTLPVQGLSCETFEEFYRQGDEFLRSGDFHGFARRMNQIAAQPNTLNKWVSKLALCQGLLANTMGQSAAKNWSRLATFVNDPDIVSRIGLLKSTMDHGVSDSDKVLTSAIEPAATSGRNGQRLTGEAYANAFAFMAGLRTPSYDPVPKRILMVSAVLCVGGSERQTVATLSGLVDRGYDVKMLVFSRAALNSPSFDHELERLGVSNECLTELPRTERSWPVCPSPCTDSLPGWFIDRVGAIAAYVKRQRPEVIHCWLDHPGIAGALAGCMSGCPRQIVRAGSTATNFRRNAWPPEMWLQAYRSMVKNPTITLVNNCHAGAYDYEKWIGLRHGTVKVVYDSFLPQSTRIANPMEVQEFRSSLGIPPDVFVVGTIMRFVEEKDPNLWLETAAEIAKARPDVKFLIFGYGVLEPDLRRAIEAFGLRQKVILAGPLADVGLGYAVMDVVLLTSAVEGLPLVMVEAQAIGRPVVAPDVGGTAEGLLEQQTGLIARPRSAARLAEATIKILDDADWRQRARVEGPQFVASRFGMDRMLNEIVRLYR